ncbi:MAG TPA: DUF1707 domain-containing protein [Natronosporangium sp.]
MGTVPSESRRPNAPEPDSGSLPAPAADDPRRRLRVSDDERQQVVEALGEHAAVGRITLGEFEERVAKAYAATTRADLDALTEDLPALSESPPPAPRTAERKTSRWFLAILGGSTRRGKRLAEQVNVVSIMGGDEIDLRDAVIEGDELTINAFSLMGGPNIYIPDTMDVIISGSGILGGDDERGSQRPPRPGAPVIRIRSFAIMGGLTVWRLPQEAHTLRLREARRLAKAIERGRR